MIRDYRLSDERALRSIHQLSGIDYRFPDLSSPLFMTKKVFEEGGEIRAACVLKVCAEAMLLVAPDSPGRKLEAIWALQPGVLSEAWNKGLDEIHAAVPNIGFDKRLRQLGWEKDRPEFSLWSRRTQ